MTDRAAAGTWPTPGDRVCITAVLQGIRNRYATTETVTGDRIVVRTEFGLITYHRDQLRRIG